MLFSLLQNIIFKIFATEGIFISSYEGCHKCILYFCRFKQIMNLIIDVGNTRTKLAVFSEGHMAHLKVVAEGALMADLEKLLTEFPSLQHAIISSVGKFPEEALRFVKNRIEVLLLTNEVAVPFTNAYGTPKTLGVDRIALVSAAAVKYPDTNVLVIDAGSCITYDFLSAQNEYLGGAISPGIQMRYKALHTFTANLPLLTATLPNTLIGHTTASSIHSGVVQGAMNEIEGFIELYQQQYPDFTIILTGGDAHLLRDSLKNSIFANPNFLLDGLHHILEHNKQ